MEILLIAVLMAAGGAALAWAMCKEDDE